MNAISNVHQPDTRYGLDRAAKLQDDDELGKSIIASAVNDLDRSYPTFLQTNAATRLRTKRRRPLR